ncbi:MAG: histone deacetylase [Caldilineaceae bacterium]
MPLPLVFHPDYVASLPPGHRFPMSKFGKVYENLIKDGIAAPDQFHLAPKAPRSWLNLAHDPAYVDSYLNGTIDARAMRRIGFPWSEELVNRTCTALGGTCLAAQLALEHGIACNCAGGTHHAFPDFGSGFCIFNDLGVAPRLLQQQGLVQKVLIVDLDVHQGDGSAVIFAGDESVFTFSIHCADNFPFRKQQSDLDVELPIGTEDDAYLQTLSNYLPDLLTQVKPDLVFYDAGVDPHKQDKLGKLALTDEGLYRRDHYVLECCVRNRTPVAGVIGGGYDTDYDRLARRHCTLHRAASEVYEQLL